MIFECTGALVTLAGVDLELLVRFYTHFLGQEPEPHIPNVYAEFQLPGLRLGIFRPKQAHQQEFENPPKVRGGEMESPPLLTGGEMESPALLRGGEMESPPLVRGGARGGAMSLCLEVRNLESAIAHLTALGYPPPGEILTASHGREIYAYDPAGNRLILHQSIVSH